MTEQNVKSNDSSDESSLVINGAIVGLVFPIVAMLIIRGVYVPACLGGAIGATGGFGYLYLNEENEVWSVLDGVKHGFAVGTSLGAVFASVSIIVENPIIIPLSIGTMAIGASLGWVITNANDDQSTTFTEGKNNGIKQFDEPQNLCILGEVCLKHVPEDNPA